MSTGYRMTSGHTYVYLVLVLYISMNLVETVPRRRRQSTLRPVQFWPDGLLPYKLSEDYTEAEKNKIVVAMRRWEKDTCIRFVPWTEELGIQMGATRYINFFRGPTCFSRNGMNQYQPQTIGLGASCLSQEGTAIHEIGHAIGLRHTMERDDRNAYINVFYENVNPDSRDNFDTTSMRGYFNYPLFNTPYDYKSIMHYGPKTWSANNKVVMVTKDPAYQSIIGKAYDVSFYDAVYVNRAYQCAANCSTQMSCQNGGEYGGKGEDNCHCICPDGFIGEQCQTPVNGFQTTVNWNCGPGWEFANGRCYRFFTEVFRPYSIAVLMCSSHNASLLSFSSASEVEWLTERTEEMLLLSSAKTFWVGVKRLAGQTTYLWENGAPYNHQLMPLHELGTADQDGCATTNGKAIVVESCGDKQNNGLICMREYDPACGGRYRLTANSVLSIHSPGYPNLYLDHDCQYVFQASRNMKIEVEMEDFDMRAEANCNDGYLLVQKTSDLTSEGTKYCGRSLFNQTMVSEENLFILTFHTNRRRQKRGFKANVKAVPSGRVPEPCNRPFRLLDMLTGRTSRCDSNTNPGNQPSSSFLDIMWNVMGSFSSSIVL